MHCLTKRRLLFLLLVLFTVSCSNSKKIPGNKLAIENSKNSSIYRFTISFFSKGGGTDRKARSEFESFLENFNKKNEVNLQYIKTSWGREGEVDYCFQLEELKKKKQIIFIKECEDLLKDSKLVHFQEFGECKNH
jgi:hypothetical protein